MENEEFEFTIKVILPSQVWKLLSSISCNKLQHFLEEMIITGIPYKAQVSLAGSDCVPINEVQFFVDSINLSHYICLRINKLSLYSWTLLGWKTELSNLVVERLLNLKPVVKAKLKHG